MRGSEAKLVKELVRFPKAMAVKIKPGSVASHELAQVLWRSREGLDEK